MANRFRPETEPRKVTAELSEGIAQLRFLTLTIGRKFFNSFSKFGVSNKLEEKKKEVLPGLEPGSLDSESRVITITL